MSNQDEISKIVADVLAANPKAIEDIKAGEDKVIGFLIGQVMKNSKGQANPALAQKLIREQINS